jgi:hypothetical protein
MLENTEGAIKNVQSRETGNFGTQDEEKQFIHSFIFIQANIKHIHLSKKHHKNITLNEIIRFKNSA